MEDNKKKRGRPSKEGSRRNRVYMYLSDIELEILKSASKTSGKSISEFSRIGAINSSYVTLSKSVCDVDEAEPEDEDKNIDDNELGYYEDDDFYDD